jgi:hypothetical protein
MLCNSAILCQDCSWFSCFPLGRSRRRNSLSGSDHFRPYPLQFRPSLDAIAQWLSDICCPRLSWGYSLLCVALELQCRNDHRTEINIHLKSLYKCIYYSRKPGWLSPYSNWPGFHSWQCKMFLFSTALRPALGSTQPSIHWLPWAVSPGLSGSGVKLTTHLHTMPRIRIRGYIHPFPHTSSWRSFTFFIYIL